MNITMKKADRGEFSTTIGSCRIVRAQRLHGDSNLVQFQLDITTGDEEPASLTATMDISKSGWSDRFAEGIATYIIANRLTEYRFRIDTVRRPSVASDIPFDKLRSEDKFPALVELEPLG